MVKGAKCFTLFYYGLLKQSRPGYNEAFLKLFCTLQTEDYVLFLC
jgi:hypothetical protein